MIRSFAIVFLIAVYVILIERSSDEQTNFPIIKFNSFDGSSVSSVAIERKNLFFYYYFVVVVN